MSEVVKIGFTVKANNSIHVYPHKSSSVSKQSQ